MAVLRAMWTMEIQLKRLQRNSISNWVRDCYCDIVEKDVMLFASDLRNYLRPNLRVMD